MIPKVSSLIRLFRTPINRLPNKVCNAIRRHKNRVLDLRFAGTSLGPERIPSRYSDMGAYGHVPTDVSALGYIFRKHQIRPDDVLVDVGCGKGRVIAWWLSHGYGNRIIGIELDEELASFAKHIFSRYYNVTIIHGDIIDSLPEDGNVFYMFNPFDRETMLKFKNLLNAGEKKQNETKKPGKDVVAIYYYPVHIDVFLDDPAFIVEKIKQPKWEAFRPNRMKCALIRQKSIS